MEAAAAHEGTVYVTKAVHYPKVLLYARVPPEDFAETAEYAYWPAAYLSPLGFTRFRFYEDAAMPLDPEGVYILWGGTDLSRWEALGFASEKHGVFTVLRR